LVAGNLAYALEFRRSGCPGRTDVAILASGPDLAPLAAEEFPGMVFLSNHELHSEPPRDALHIVRPNLPGNVSLPLVAIAPAPTAQPDECDRPPVADWQALTLNGGGLPLSP